MSAQENNKREIFLKVYANLPLNARKEVILILEAGKQPITWEVAYLEIKNDTQRSKEILEKLKELGLL